MNSMFGNLQRLLRSRGIDVRGYHPFTNMHARYEMLMQKYGVNCIFDVGANEGQFAQRAHASGFSGRILSYEPNPDVFAVLKARAEHNTQWQAFQNAVGSEPGTLTFNIAEESQMSSLLQPDVNSVQSVSYTKQISVEVTTIDREFERLLTGKEVVLLKSDTQGYEKSVMEGAVKSLPRCRFLLLELSFTPTYDGEMTYEEMVAYLKERHFEPSILTSIFWDEKTDVLAHVDALFINTQIKS